jgi:hypothetical protein
MRFRETLEEERYPAMKIYMLSCILQGGNKNSARLYLFYFNNKKEKGNRWKETCPHFMTVVYIDGLE